MRDLYHITLDTGDAAMIPASHVQPKTMAVMRGILATLSAGSPAMLPVPGEWRVTAGQDAGRCLSAMVEARIGEEWVGVVWLGVAQHSRCGASLWVDMHSLPISQPKTNADRQPATPWLASRMLPGSVLIHPQSMAWIADFEECLAWAWISQ